MPLARSRQVFYVTGVQEVEGTTREANPVPNGALIGNPGGQSLPFENLPVHFGSRIGHSVRP